MTKHAAVRQFYAKEQYQLGNILPIHKSTTELTADVLTKNLTYNEFVKKSTNVKEIPLYYREKCEAVVNNKTTQNNFCNVI